MAKQFPETAEFDVEVGCQCFTLRWLTNVCCEVYVRYTDDDQKTVIHRIGESIEANMWFAHNVLETKKKDRS